MNELQTFDISHFPGIAEIARKALVIGRNEDYENRKVTLLVRVEHYTLAGARINSMTAIERTPFLLIASDESFVNPQTGALVFPDPVTGQYPAGSISEYAFLKAAVDDGVNPNTLVQGAILQADALGRFN
jgi:hypothetical protein